MRQAGFGDVKLMVGGIIPEADIPKLQAMGVARVFGPGTSLDDIVGYIRGQPEPGHSEASHA